MKEIFVIFYSATGRIKNSGTINREWDAANYDGSTISERISYELSNAADLDVAYSHNQPLPDKSLVKIVDYNIVPLSEIELSEQKSEEEAEEQRLFEIKAEKKLAGFEKISVGAAWVRVDELFENKTTIPQLRSACIKAFKLLVVLLLR